MILLPTAGVYLFINETFEFVLLGISLVFNMTNVCFGYRQHKSNKAVAVLALGLFVFVVGRLMHRHSEDHEIHFDTNFHFDKHMQNLFLVTFDVSKDIERF